MKYDRVFNFSAGPSMMPLEVLEQAQKELLNYHGTGESVMEMSHRSAEFKEIIEQAEKDLRDLLNIPENYKVLFLQGGGTLQFSMIPINLLFNSKKADYILTGNWAKKAYQEACKFGDIRVAASSEESNYTYIPETSRSDFRSDADYVYVCYNNTIYGSHFNEIPDVGDLTLVADMSSCLLSEEIDVSRFGLIYAGAQKNIAPAGLTIVIVREDLIGHAPKDTPVYLDYETHAKKDSMYNTPPCFNIYMAGLVFRHLKKMGGISAMHAKNVAQAEKLYGALDALDFYNKPVRKKDRSLMNVVFTTPSKELDAKFVQEAKEHGMINVKGHRSVGGIRTSIFNAMPDEGVDTLVEFIRKFAEENA
ncbi:MAG: 3-phosphoserine/phosphohydroxythreonine transaminase [Eubacteriales bacterium]|nr:3-phosphoserine/phosphohydroxythreonine transaminase [Eubacteriales bacterium]